MLQQTARDARLVFENAKAAIASIKDPITGAPMYNLNQVKLTQSYIRSDVFLSTTLAAYKFPIKVNDTFNGTPVLSTENRLQLQDLFIVSSVQIGLYLGSSSTNNGRVVYFPDSSIFTTGASSLYTLYNGQLVVNINNETIVPSWDVQRHLKVPNQQSATNAYYTTSGVNYISEVDGMNDGSASVEPNWILSGGANIDVQLRLPSAPATLDANTRVVLQLRGVLAQNASAVK